MKNSFAIVSTILAFAVSSFASIRERSKAGLRKPYQATQQRLHLGVFKCFPREPDIAGAVLN